MRSYAILCEAEVRLSRWYADSMFVDTVVKSTRTEPHLFLSWICNKGAGPVKILPELTDDEVRILRSKNGSLIDPDNLPMTWQAMRELWIKRDNEDDLTEDEVEFMDIFEKLPVPYGLLEKHERLRSFVSKLDQIWRVMEVITAGQGSKLLELDSKKYTKSQGV